MASFTVERTFREPMQAIWSRVGSFTREQQGEVTIKVEDPGQGEHHLGAIRTVTMRGKTYREQLVESIPPRRIAYRLLEGAPVKDYLGTVELEPGHEGTHLRWSVTFTPPPRVPGFLVAFFARRNIVRVLDHLERLGAP